VAETTERHGGGTDFENYGLSTGPLSPRDRYLVLTVDFEAFAPDAIHLWTAAMEYWSERAAAAGLVFTYFIAVEDTALLRAQDAQAYRAFVSGLHALASAGGEFHPHNHRVFEGQTGATLTPQGAAGQEASGYPRRASMFYDVVYRHRRDWAEWMQEVTHAYESLLADAAIGAPAKLAFRPGGWDHGATREDLARYLEGVAEAGYSIDSSATAGVFGEASWRVGAPAGGNVYGLPGGLVEIAPCISMDCGASLVSRRGLSLLKGVVTQSALWRPPFPELALVVVLHLDHLFHEVREGRTHYFAVHDEQAVRRRVDRAFRQLAALRSALRLTSAGISEVGVQAPQT
jgi:hypothetical protein